MSDRNKIQPTDPVDRLDAYLDGLLSPTEQQAFEQELATDESLRNACDLQREVDGSLGRLFVAPAPPVDILALVDRELPNGPINQLAERVALDATKRRRRMIVAVLAASVAWVVVGWKVYRDSTNDGYRQVALADIYQTCVANGFRPKWVCEDDREFAATFERRQGLPLLLKAEAKAGMVGLSYLKGISRQTTTMLARVEGQPVLVFVDKLERDTHPEKPSWWSGLKLFRHELGTLVLYEVTPFSEPTVLGSFYIPEPTSLSDENKTLEASP